MNGDKWTLLVVGFLILLFLNSTILTLATLNMVYIEISWATTKKQWPESITKIPMG